MSAVDLQVMSLKPDGFFFKNNFLLFQELLSTAFRICMVKYCTFWNISIGDDKCWIWYTFIHIDISKCLMSPYNQFKLLIINFFKYLSEILLYFIRTSLKYIIYCNIPPRLNKNNVVFFFQKCFFLFN